MSPLKK